MFPKSRSQVSERQLRTILVFPEPSRSQKIVLFGVWNESVRKWQQFRGWPLGVATLSKDYVTRGRKSKQSSQRLHSCSESPYTVRNYYLTDIHTGVIK